jgi:hypothetical protein
MLATSALDATPELIVKMPEDSFAPLVTALAATTIGAGALTHAWNIAIVSGVVLLAAVFSWLWPRRELGQTAEGADE